ncbi:hypothetical protein [Haloplanus salinarum]|uniref:hypothetical protein n=1 Tax=Haloplanus salinarum TaxID=1912324 RepID=UPI00214BAB12|nr:hypothetical protein [Haloplanus salinarum]
MISFTDWLSESLSTLRSGDRSLPARLARPLYYVYVAALLSITQHVPYGTNVYERDWDLLIILDACRVDALREVADEYEFITEVESMRSVGSTSFEWLNHTFTKDYLDEVRRTALVTGNGYTDRVFGEGGETGSAAIPFGPSAYDVVDPEDFGYLEELWRADVGDEWMVGEDDRTRRHPRHTTERTIDVARSVDSDRLIVHYLYPHDPYPLAGEELWRPFDALKSGTASREEVWEAYLDTLRFVLDDVAVLLENVDAETVAITADHGEAFGEFGFYRHVIGCPLPCMRNVPWVETTATDEGTCEPTASAPSTDDETVSVEERLEQLGYL